MSINEIFESKMLVQEQAEQLGLKDEIMNRVAQAEGNYKTANWSSQTSQFQLDMDALIYAVQVGQIYLTDLNHQRIASELHDDYHTNVSLPLGRDYSGDVPQGQVQLKLPERFVNPVRLKLEKK